MPITNHQVEAIEAEVELAIETHAKSINKENCLEILAFKIHKGSTLWTINHAQPVTNLNWFMKTPGIKVATDLKR